MSVEILAKFDQRILDLVKAEKLDQALWIAEESYEFARNKFGEIHLETAKSLNNLAWLYDRNKRYDVAEVFYLRAIGLKKAICGKESIELVVSLENLSSLYLSQRKYTKAQRLLEKLIKIVQHRSEPWLFRKAVYLSQLADIKKYQGDMSAAESLYHKCAAYIESTMPLDHPNLGRIFANIGDFYMVIDKHLRAQIYYHRAYTILNKKTPKKHPDIQYIVGQMNKIQSLQPLLQSNSGRRR